MVKPHLRPVRLFLYCNLPQAWSLREVLGSGSMRVILNGEEQEIRDDISIADLLSDLKISLQYGAVAVNRKGVRKRDHEATRLRAGDRIEIVRPVGGG